MGEESRAERRRKADEARRTDWKVFVCVHNDFNSVDTAAGVPTSISAGGARGQRREYAAYMRTKEDSHLVDEEVGMRVAEGIWGDRALTDPQRAIDPPKVDIGKEEANEKGERRGYMRPIYEAVAGKVAGGARNDSTRSDRKG